ncbi:ead/Ea22-like family protein [Raoultella terrigena]
MTTDITELAQSLKAAAEKATQGNWRAFKYHDGRCGIGGGHHDEIMVCEHISKRRPHDAEFIALANPANILALVEALEKAQAKNALVAGGIEASTKLHERIAELDAELEREREKSRRVMSRIAELESRSVKLPQRYDLIGDTDGNCSLNDAEMAPDNDGVYLRVRDVREMLTAAGIKWEAE